MKKTNSRMLSTQGGFTLVELMIVVAIIGILSAIAVPNFRKYQAKSKTSEAKIQLAAAFTAEVSFHADFATYHQCLRYMGFNPDNESQQRYYTVGFQSIATQATNDNIATSNGAIISATGCVSGGGDGQSIFGGVKAVGATVQVTTAASLGANAAGTVTAYAEDSFELAAVGIIDKNFTADTDKSGFTINEVKFIRNYVPGY